MDRVRQWISRFFFPPEGTPLWLRLAPYIVLGVISLAVLISSAYAWEYTNSPEFCGQACHTMPPEYTSYLTSPHARVKCVECHIGRGFIATRVTRKAGDVKHIVAQTFKTYEYPIEAEQLRPARETCERCHFPEKFSNDSLQEIKHYRSDRENSSFTRYLVTKTGGGSERLGLGKGIHWHIENPVYFYATDHNQQHIPFVRVENPDGTVTDYVDIESDLNPPQLSQNDLEKMDCITCHNRITHLVEYPEDIIDKLLERGLIAASIPEIRRVALDLFYREYVDNDQAVRSFDTLHEYYHINYPRFYQQQSTLVSSAIDELQTAYTNSVFPQQKFSWASHANNIGHENTPGCFRCHDGKHLTAQKEAIRLECNLCHSIPVEADSGELVAEIEISRGPEPESHFNTNWISLHHEAFNESCANCHTTADPGGTSNTSFCSNSACHGLSFEYAGFDAPALRETIIDQLPPTPTPTALPESQEELPLTYNAAVQPILEAKCGQCHNQEGVKGLNLLTYDAALEGSENGPVILPGDPENSLLIQVTTAQEPHFSQFDEDELALIREWIEVGTPEN